MQGEKSLSTQPKFMSKKSNSFNFDKEIALSVGLNESIVIQYLKTNSIQTFDILMTELSFFDEKELNRILKKLIKLKLVEEFSNGSFCLKSKNEGSKVERKKNISKEYLPSKNILKEAKSLGVSQEFIQNKLPEFRSYWTDRGDKSFSWDYKFLKYLLKEWRSEEEKLNKVSKMKPIQKNWKPSKEALKILQHAEIEEKFIIDALPEFVLYWSERNTASDSWNSKFLNHVKNQWVRYKNLISMVRKPTRMDKDWRPSEDCFDVLSLAKINKSFAISQIPEFKLYWLETKEMRNCWNSKFIQHVKYKWKTKNGNVKNVLSRLKDHEWAVNFKN
tara:strand:- start:10531 stop:11526 length:996 start_codon:yes stop_codon:yes gene_type:complete